MFWVGVLLYLVGLLALAVSLAAPAIGVRKRLNFSGRAGTQELQRSYLERIRWMMWQAGWEKMAPSAFVMAQVVGGVLFFLGGLLLGGLGGALLGGAAAVAVPYTYLEIQRANRVEAYNAAFPTMLSVLLEHLRHEGANLPAALQATAKAADEAFQHDLLGIAAAFSAGAVDLARLQHLVNQRSSPFLQRLVSVLVARKDNLSLLLEDLTTMLVETQQDASLLTKIKTSLQMPSLTLSIIGVGAPLMFVGMLFMFPSLRDYYVLTPTGNLISFVAVAFMLGIGAWGRHKLQQQSLLLSPQFVVPESRPESAFFGDEALGEPQQAGE